MKRPILDLCKRMVRRLGGWVSRRWCEQEGIDLACAREWAVMAADREDENGGEDMTRKEMTGRN